MPKLKLTATTTQTATVEVKLAPQVRTMIAQRAEEHAKLAIQVKDIKGTKAKPGRMKRIEEEVTALFKKEKQGKALLNGTAINGHKLKLVIGTSKKFDQLGFMKKHGLTQADFDEFTEDVDNTPYLKMTHPGEDEE